ncbi:MAG: hypothetical protein ACRDQ9_11580, partial [Pseudonocardiaceae bacterium]
CGVAASLLWQRPTPARKFESSPHHHPDERVRGTDSRTDTGSWVTDRVDLSLKAREFLRRVNPGGLCGRPIEER